MWRVQSADGLFGEETLNASVPRAPLCMAAVAIKSMSALAVRRDPRKARAAYPNRSGRACGNETLLISKRSADR